MFSKRSISLCLLSIITGSQALDGITAPSTVAAGSPFQVSFQNGDSGDKYRVYLAASLAGHSQGPTCYLLNSTTLSSPIELTVPAVAGPSGNYYTIAISDLSSSPAAAPVYSAPFNLTGGTATYTPYETHLGGAPFWDADALPCASYDCARLCAQASYPQDLTDTGAYAAMQNCILRCPGVALTAETTPAQASGSGDVLVPTTVTAERAVITLAGGEVVTAVETTVTSGGAKATEAVVGASMTVTLGGAEATVSGDTLSLVSNGVEVGKSTTVSFQGVAATMVTVAPTSTTVAPTSAIAAAKSSGLAARNEMRIASVAGFAGLAALIL